MRDGSILKKNDKNIAIKNCLTCLNDFIPKSSKNQIFCSIICHNRNIGMKKLNRSNEERFESLKRRFEKYVIKTDQCWDWNGCKNKSGYGEIRYGKRILAHRASWIIHFGEIPKGMFVLHKCDTPSCTKPQDLFLGTHTDNMQDKLKKGRMRGGFVKGQKAHNRVINEEIARAIKYDLYNSDLNQREIAEKYYVKRNIIADIKSNKAWKFINMESK